jgi:predicted Zn-dependent protease
MDANAWLQRLNWNERQLQDLRLCAYVYIRQGVYDFGLTILEALAVLDPSNAYDLQTMGAIHLQLGNNIKALEILNAALKADPANMPTRLNLSKALLSLGYKKQGLAQAASIEKESSDAELKEQAGAILFAYSEKD